LQIITSANGLLRTLAGQMDHWAQDGPRIVTHLPAMDALLPGGTMAAGAMHEVLSATDTPAFLLPALLAKAALNFGRIVWCDFDRQFNPAAAAGLGLPTDRLLVLRPHRKADELWAIAETLRCKGVGACVAPAARLTRVQVRQLQLAAERGGGIGILLRPAAAISWPYAAATRWLVKPHPGERSIQRCSVELIHGHGGRIGQPVFLEVCRETHHVRVVETVAHRQNPQEAKTVSA
jgi:protein ImuA